MKFTGSFRVVPLKHLSETAGRRVGYKVTHQCWYHISILIGTQH